MKWILIVSLAALTGCASCEDNAQGTDNNAANNGGDFGAADMTDVGPGNLDTGSSDAALDMSLDLSPDLSAADDMGLTDMTEDMGADMRMAPRDVLKYVSHSVIQDPRQGSIRIAADGNDGYYVGLSTAGRPVVFDANRANPVEYPTVQEQAFQVLFAHYDANDALVFSQILTRYPGSATTGGTAELRAMDLETNGTILMGVNFAGAIEFGSTTYQTKRGTSSAGATSVSREIAVIRYDPANGSVVPLVRAVSPSAFDSNYPNGVVAHPNGDFTLVGAYRGELLIDGEQTPRLTGTYEGFVARFDSAGQPLYVKAFAEGFPRVSAVGDDVLVAIQQDNAFDFDGVTYSATATDQNGSVLARLSSTGTLQWIRRIQCPQVPYIHEPLVAPDGSLWATFRMCGGEFRELQTPPATPGHAYLVNLNANTGDVEQLFELDLPNMEDEETRQLVVDQFGVLWSPITYLPTADTTLQPVFGPPLSLEAFDSEANNSGYALMTGWDPDSHELLFVHRVSDGYGSVQNFIELDDGEFLMTDRVYYSRMLEPGTPDEYFQMNAEIGGDADMTLLRYR